MQKPEPSSIPTSAATLTHEDAQSIYEAMLPGMLAGYGLNVDPVADDYVTWPRYNTAPYRSATHGQRQRCHSGYRWRGRSPDRRRRSSQSLVIRCLANTLPLSAACSPGVAFGAVCRSMIERWALAARATIQPDNGSYQPDTRRFAATKL